MARMPDFLSNMLTKDPDLVDDSPQFRQKHQEMQKSNLMKAANSALDVVRDRTRQSEIDTIKTQMQMIQDMTPAPVPLAGPDATFFDEAPPEMSTPIAPNIPGPNDFDVGNTDHMSIPPPDPSMADTNTDPMMPQQDEVAEIQRIAQETGLTPQQVAAMTLLGQDIDKLEKEGALTPTQQLMAKSGADIPQLAGPGSADITTSTGIIPNEDLRHERTDTPGVLPNAVQSASITDTPGFLPDAFQSADITDEVRTMPRGAAPGNAAPSRR